MPIINPSLESIQFQNTQFRDELIVAMQAIDEMDAKNVPDSEQEERLGRLINEYTGLNIAVSFGDRMPMIGVPDVNKNNILINNYIRQFLPGVDGLSFLQKNDGIMRGKVDLVRNKVSGVFAEFPAVIHMPLKMVGGKYTPGEKAAIILHEVGHLFTYCEFMANITSVNQALSSMSKALDKSGNIQEREVIMLSVKKALKLKDLDEKELAKSNNTRVIEAVVVSAVSRESKSQLGRSIYDSTSWEYLADQYAARCGAARDLVTALDKLYRGSWNISFRSLPAYLFMEVVKIAVGFLVPALSILLYAIDGNDASYDRPGARMLRMRSQLIENLKDKSLSKDDVVSLEEDINVIDGIVKEANDRRQFLTAVWDFVSPSARKDRNYTHLQQELESLATNDLFLKAAQLRTSA